MNSITAQYTGAYGDPYYHLGTVVIQDIYPKLKSYSLTPFSLFAQLFWNFAWGTVTTLACCMQLLSEIEVKNTFWANTIS